MVYQLFIVASQTFLEHSALKQWPFITYNSVGQEIPLGLSRNGSSAPPVG